MIITLKVQIGRLVSKGKYNGCSRNQDIPVKLLLC